MNDPRFTAYALGELEASQRGTFERELASSEELQNELKEIVALVEALPGSLDSTDPLTDAQRNHLRRQCADNRRSLRHGRTARHRMAIGATATLAAGLAVAAMVLSARHGQPHATAQNLATTKPAPAATASPAALAPLTPAASEIADRLSEAGKFVTRGSYDLAADRFKAVLALDPENGDARHGLAQIATAKSAKPAEGLTANLAALTKSAPGDLAMRRIPPTHPVLPAAPASQDVQTFAALDSSKDEQLRETSTLSGGTVQTSAGKVPILGDVPLVGRLSPAYPAEFEPPPIPQTATPADDESYAPIHGNPFQDVRTNPLSTFSIDVDTGSYANVRRFLSRGQLPPPDAVRIEELLNYFPYAYPQPEGDAPFSVNTEVSRAPWDPDLLLARVALKGRDLPADKLPPSNFVFLIDVSGSMASDDKLPLLKRSLGMLVERISPADHVAIVTYAGESGVPLPSTSGDEKSRILRAIDGLEAGGSTNGAAGIGLAYEIARQNFVEGGSNRVILCTDGDFNVGLTSMNGLTRLIESERHSSVFLSVLGFGTGNLKDATMEMLADKGNGNYAYIDSPAEGRKVLVDQMRSNLFTIAKDVKIQVEFNPATVAGYRLLGYEKRLLAKEDFNNDRKDAGEIGAGHAVTALYEIVPAGRTFPSGVDPLKYQTPAAAKSPPTADSASTDLFTVKLRYKMPEGDRSQLVEKATGPKAVDFAGASEDFRFATAVAAFGMKLRQDESDPALDWSEIQKIARGSLGEDAGTYRAEFLTLIQKAKEFSPEER